MMRRRRARLRAGVAADDEVAVGVLAAALAGVGVLDAAGAEAILLAVVATKEKKRSVTRNPTLMICIRGGEDTHFQKKVQPPLLELSSDSVGASQVYASHVP